jgi:hypothetical protein
MTYEMKGEDVGAAAEALLNWIESQNINPHDAVRVLTASLVALIHEISVTKGLNAKEGGQVIADIIVESLP